MTPSLKPTASPRPRQRFSEPGAYSAAEDAVLSLIRHMGENAEITSFERLAELTGLTLADAEKTARRLVGRGCLKVVQIYEGVAHSPLEFRPVRGWDNPDVRPGTLLSAR